MIQKTVTMILKKDEICVTKALTQGDYGQRLIFKGYDLPYIYEVHFSNEKEGKSKSFPGDETGADIPDEYLLSGKDIYVWVFMHNALDDGRTVFRGQIPVLKKALPVNEPITPVQQDAFTQMMALLEQATDNIPVEINTALQEAKDSGEFDGFSPIVDVVTISGGHRVTITDTSGDHAFDIMDGVDGNGISGAYLNVDYTLTLTFTDGTSYTTPSIRGENGEQGAVFIPSLSEDGILSWTNNGGLPNPDPVSIVPDLSEYAKKSEVDTELQDKIDISLAGVPNGIATLGEDGTIPTYQLPSFTDDVCEYRTITLFPNPGESGKIYIARNTNKMYRWDGASKYVEIGVYFVTKASQTDIGKALSPKTIVDGEVTEWKFISGGGGGGGTSDYNDLSNKPQIAGVTLIGNKTLHDLGAAAESAIPTKVSDLQNDSGFIATETDPTVPNWAKQPTKPSYMAQEVGALPANTPIPSKTSDLTNDSGYLTSETDPTVPSWAKQPNKPSYIASEVGALSEPVTAGINGQAIVYDGNGNHAWGIPNSVEVVRLI